MHSSFLSGKTKEVIRLFLLLYLERLVLLLQLVTGVQLIDHLLIEYRALKADAVWDFSYLAASQVVVKSAELCSTVWVALLERAWLIHVALRAHFSAEVQTECGAVLAGLSWLGWVGLGWEPSGSCRPGCVPQLLLVPGAKISPKLSLAGRRGVAVFQEEMRNHFTILDWLEKWRAIQSPSVSSDLLVCGEISNCHRESSSLCHPRGVPLLCHPLAPVKLLSVKANPSSADRVTAFSTSKCCRSFQEWHDAGIWSQLQLLCVLQRVQGNKETKSSRNFKIMCIEDSLTKALILPSRVYLPLFWV